MAKIKHKTAAIIEAIRQNNGLVTHAAKALGCYPSYIWSRAKEEPEVQAAIDEAREVVLDLAESGLINALSEREAWAIAFALKTIGKKRGYVERIEQTGADGKDIEIKIDWGGNTEASK